MLQERTTMAGILATMREIISDEQPSDALPQMASPDALQPNVVAPQKPRPRSDISEPPSLISPDVLEAVFAGAIREGISPPVQRWVDTHQAELIGALSPMIRRWMDNHLPKMVESVLKEELGRAIGNTLRRST